MKKQLLFRYIYILVVVFLSLNLKAQQVPIYNQYNFNQFIFNPAMAGYKLDNSRITFTHRKQWSGVVGAPNTTLISFNGVSDGNLGYGGYAYYDKTGYIYTSSMYGVYSYTVTLFQDFRLGAGIGTGFNFLGLDPAIYNRYTQSDNIVSNSLGMESRYVFDMGLLISYYGFDLGISAPNILSGVIDKSDNSDKLYSAVRHYLFTLGYNLPLNMPFLGKFNGDILLKPMIMTRLVNGIPFSYEGQVMLDIKKIGWVNLGYKGGVPSKNPQFQEGFYIGESDLFFGMGYNFTPNVSVGYTFGTGITSTLSNQGINHELVLVYNLGGGSKKMKKLLEEEIENKEKEKLEYIDAMEKRMKKLQDSLERKLKKEIIINQNEIQELRENIDESVLKGDGGKGFVQPKNLEGGKSNIETNKKEDASTMPSNVVAGSKGFYIVAGAFKFRENAERRGKEMGDKGLENSIFFDEAKELYYVFLRKFKKYEDAVRMRGNNLNGKYRKFDFKGDSIWIREIK